MFICFTSFYLPISTFFSRSKHLKHIGCKRDVHSVIAIPASIAHILAIIIGDDIIQFIENVIGVAQSFPFLLCQLGIDGSFNNFHFVYLFSVYLYFLSLDFQNFLAQLAGLEYTANAYNISFSQSSFCDVVGFIARAGYDGKRLSLRINANVGISDRTFHTVFSLIHLPLL
nr:MAG TPA: hypothetical protein [Caudoviricetes sp.]